MSIYLKKLRQSRARKENNIPRTAMNLFSLLFILLITGCGGNVSPALPQFTQALESPLPASLTPDAGPVNGITEETASRAAMQMPVTSITFAADGDAYIKQSDPDTNYGNERTLKVDRASDDAVESFVHFTVTDLPGTVQKAVMRLYTGASGASENGPAVHAADIYWSAETITWNNRPVYGEDALDNADQVKAETWVEYDVTPVVTGSGIYTFALVADSGDAAAFSSLEGDWPPELVVTFTPIPTPTLSPEDVVLAGAGSISLCANDNDELTARLLDGIPGTVFTTGDNAYEDGTYQEFMDCYGPTWGRHKDRTYPVPGKQEYDTPEAGGYFQYFNNVPSYYAYDLGSWRIYALNSETRVAEDSKQVKWLKIDLATHPRQCVLAYWNTPRWSSGEKHGSSADMQVLWDILYASGAELVINGLEQNYERFTPMNAGGQADPQGVRQIVVGTGGGDLDEFGPILPTSEVRNASTYGVLKLTLRANSYDWEFVPVPGSTFTDRGSTQCH